MDVRCPFCGANVAIPEDNVAETIPCPACREDVDVATAILLADMTPQASAAGSGEGWEDGDRGHKPTEAYSRDANAIDTKAPPVERVGSYGYRSHDLASAKEKVFPGEMQKRKEKPPSSPEPKPAEPPSASCGEPGFRRPPPPAFRPDPPPARRVEPAATRMDVPQTGRVEAPPAQSVFDQFALGDVLQSIQPDHGPSIPPVAGRIDSEALFRPDPVFQTSAEPQAAPQPAAQPAPPPDPPPAARTPSISDFDLPAFDAPPVPAATEPPTKSDDPLAALNLSFDDLLGGFDKVGSSFEKRPDGKEAPSRPEAAAASIGSLDLDSVLREDSVAEAKLPWAEGAGAAGKTGAPAPTSVEHIEPRGLGGTQAYDASAMGIDLPDVWPQGGDHGAAPAKGGSSLPFEDVPSFPGGGGEPGGAADLGLEIDLGGGVPQVDRQAAVAPVAAQTAQRVAAPARRVSGRGAGLKALALVLALVVLVGVVLGQTGYGYFGINLFVGEATEQAIGRKALPQPGVATGISRDTKEAFQREVTRLERAVREDPKNAQARADLLEVLQRYRERYPRAFAGDAKLEARLKELQTQTRMSGQKADIVKVMDLVSSKKYDEARAVLDGMVVASAQDADVLYFYGKIALGQGKPDEAEKYFELTLLKNPTSVAAKYFLALAYIAKKEPAKASTTLGEILAAEPGHLPSKVRLAELALAGHDADQAARIAGEVIGKATTATDANEIFESHMVLASVAEGRGAREERLNELRAALAIAPDHEGTAVLASTLLAEAGKNDEALAVLEPCRVKPCTGEDFLARYARAAYDVGKDEVAEAALKEGEEKYPESPVFHLIKGRELLDAKFTRAAVDAFEKALQIDPSSVEANVSLAQGLRAEGKLGEAVTRLKAAIEKNESVPLLLELARTNQDQHDWGAAETALRRAVTLEPANTRIQQDLGTMIAEQGRAEEASRILAALDAKGALDRAGLVILAAAYLQMHELGRGRDLLARLYAKFPEDADIASEYGRALTEAGSFQRADEVLKKAASDTPGHAPTHYQLGKLRIRQNELPGAIEEFSRAVQLAQTNQKYRLELARALLVAGGGDRARDARLSLDAVVAAYQRGDVQQDERDPEAYILRGRMLFEEQKYPQAMKDFEAALVLAPSRLDTLVGFGRSLFEMARYSDAEPYFRQILTRDAMHAEANYYLGRILLRAGRIDEAKVHLEKSVARDGKLFPEAHRQLGFIYKDQGMIPLARRAFTSYLDLAQKGTAEVEEVRRMLDRLKK